MYKTVINDITQLHFTKKMRWGKYTYNNKIYTNWYLVYNMQYTDMIQIIQNILLKFGHSGIIWRGQKY